MAENVAVSRELESERREHLRTKIKLAAKERELHDITESGSYRLAKKLALFKHLIKKVFNLLVGLNPKRIYMISKNRKYVEGIYASTAFTDAFSEPRNADVAVAIHLYYPEMAPYFAKKLKRIGSIEHDLFVTIPDTKWDARQSVKRVLPGARIAMVPNGGRDVLPFVMVAKRLMQMGHTKVLKLHSKKSPHRADGEVWRDRIVESLLPKDVEILNLVIKTLDKKAAIVGPSGEYVSLLVNYAATGHHTQRLVSRLVSKKAGREMSSKSDEYGFFAGTMFWADMASLKPLLDVVGMSDFEPELGQVDSTMAHALERLFCLIPELYEMQMFEVSHEGVNMIEYHTTNIPNWSELYINPD